MSNLLYEIEHFNPYSPRVSELTAIPSGPDVLADPGRQHGGHFSPNREPTQTVEFVHPSGGSLDSAESATVKISSVGCTPSRRPAPIPVTVIHHGETRPESNSSKVADTTESPLSIKLKAIAADLHWLAEQLEKEA